MIGIGTDAVDIERFRRVLARTPRLAERLFTDDERAYASARRDPTQPLAARFAAKEATLKALGVGLGGAAFRDIEVRRSRAGVPWLALSGQAATLADDRGVARWLVTMSHTDLVAIATVVAE
ncbi:MAG: holo-ACP synthase [Acidimicrobiia bacterium]|nr:holo-ACP synthase [Acidimicrobiia bacterium]